MGFYWSFNLAMLCVRIVLTEFKMTVVLDNLDQEWKRVRLARDTAFLELNSHLHTEETLKAAEAAKKLLGFEEKPAQPNVNSNLEKGAL
jgi:hypothetical protein